MPFNLQKTVNTGHGGFKQRLHIKRFACEDDACKFLGKQTNNDWQIAKDIHQDKKSGIYLFAGGQWLNTKHLDPSITAHC